MVAVLLMNLTTAVGELLIAEPKLARFPKNLIDWDMFSTVSESVGWRAEAPVVTVVIAGVADVVTDAGE